MGDLINLDSIPAIDDGEIDSQHDSLIGSLNNLYTLASGGKGKEELGKTIGFCEKYTQEHFSTEEDLMKKIKFPMDEQLKQHNWFRGEIKKLRDSFDKGELTNESAVEIAIMLNNWFLNHIKVEDLKYKEYL